MKFIHLSNVNLETDAPGLFPGIDPKKERWDALKKVVDSCAEQSIDALFITGNLFAKRPDAGDLTRLDSLFSTLTDTRVFYLTGKNDAPESSKGFGFEWKSHTTVFTGDSIQRVYLPKYDAEITAVGYCEKTWSRISLSQVTRGKKGTIQILLLPFLYDGETAGGLDSFNPGFDYTGLGQTVLYKGNGKNRVFAPGIFSAEDFSSQISHGYFLCTATAGKKQEVALTRQFIQGAGREYITLKVGLNPELTYTDISRQLSGIVDKYGKENIYEIILEGGMSPTVYRKKDGFLDLGYVSRLDDRTDMDKTVEGFKTYWDDEAVARFAQALFTSPADELTEKALAYGMKALYPEDTVQA